MPYIKKEFQTIKGKKIEEFLETLDIDLKLCLSLLEKGKISDENNKRLQKNQILKSDFIYIVIFEPLSKGLKPIFDSFHFAIFDKPSGIMVRPSSHQLNVYTLLDEIKYHFGEKGSLVHRIDAETSGLVLVAKNAFSDMILKSMFEEKQYSKKYKALVAGEIKEELTINTPITNDDGLIKLKMKTDISGKESTTIIKPIYYDEENFQILTDDCVYAFYHEQDCCESVWLTKVDGISDKLIGSRIVIAEVVTDEKDTEHGHITWTFYKIGTNKGIIDFRFQGESDGYYSETVDLVKIEV